jgi:hypothetical protein
MRKSGNKTAGFVETKVTWSTTKLVEERKMNEFRIFLVYKVDKLASD